MIEDALSILAYSDYSLKRMDNSLEEKMKRDFDSQRRYFMLWCTFRYWICRFFLHTHIFRYLNFNYKYSFTFLAWEFKLWIISDFCFTFCFFKVKIFAYPSSSLRLLIFYVFNEKFPWTPKILILFRFVSEPLKIKPQHSITYVQSRINEGFCVTVTRLTCDEMCDTFEAFDC